MQLANPATAHPSVVMHETQHSYADAAGKLRKSRTTLVSRVLTSAPLTVLRMLGSARAAWEVACGAACVTVPWSVPVSVLVEAIVMVGVGEIVSIGKLELGKREVLSGCREPMR